MAQKVVHISGIGEVTLKKNPRSKRIRLYVKPDKQVIVSLPMLASFKSAEKFALKNTSWILKQKSKLNDAFTSFSANSVYYTKNHLIKIQEKNIEKIEVKKEEKTVIINVPQNIDMEAAREFIQNVFTEVYRFEAKQYLPGRLHELAQKHGFGYNRVTVRNNKSNWGSCSSSNNISLNLNLMKLPDYLIDYIILHELAHTEVKNHSADFYRVLDRVTGGRARELAKEIKQYSTYTY